MISPLHLIKRKGLAETVFYGLSSAGILLLSRLKIVFLRIRGYDIDYSANLRGGNIFFQSRKNSIRIAKNVTLGSEVKICTGFEGEITVNEGAGIYDGTMIDIHRKLDIGRNTLIAPFCYITDYDHKSADISKPIKDQGFITKPVSIGRNVWLGAKVIILKGVSIGDNSIIGAGSVVTRDIPPNSIAVGNPAKVIKKIVK